MPPTRLLNALRIGITGERSAKQKSVFVSSSDSNILGDSDITFISDYEPMQMVYHVYAEFKWGMRGKISAISAEKRDPLMTEDQHIRSCDSFVEFINYAQKAFASDVYSDIVPLLMRVERALYNDDIQEAKKVIGEIYREITPDQFVSR